MKTKVELEKAALMNWKPATEYSVANTIVQMMKTVKPEMGTLHLNVFFPRNSDPAIVDMLNHVKRNVK